MPCKCEVNAERLSCANIASRHFDWHLARSGARPAPAPAMSSAALVVVVMFLVIMGYALFVWACLIPWASWWFRTFAGLLNLVYLHLSLVRSPPPAAR